MQTEANCDREDELLFIYIIGFSKNLDTLEVKYSAIHEVLAVKRSQYNLVFKWRVFIRRLSNF